VDVQILGPLRVLRDGTELDIGRPKQRLLLAVLATANGETVSVDRLVDELWGELPPPRVASSLQAYVSKLRQVLEPDRPPRTAATVLVTRAPGYALLLEPDQLDASRFATLADGVRHLLQERRFERAYEASGRALALWRGDVLADLADEDVARRVGPRWAELRTAVTEDRLEAAVELGLHATALADLEQLVTAHPLRERGIALLVRALYVAGRPVEALERFRAYRRQLQDELGLDPGAALRALETAILQQDPALAPRAATDRIAVASVATAADEGDTPDQVSRPAVTSAPVGAGDLVGRAAELRAAEDLLADVGAGDPRWWVIAGEPGIGKTRLAEETATRAAAAGVEVSWGRCHEDGDAPPYWPWSQLLRSIVGGDADPIADLLTAAELPLDPAARRYRLHERIAELLVAGGPRLLVIDDAQWADPASLQLLSFLAVQVRGEALGFLLTVRSGVDHPELRPALATVARHPGAVHTQLAPLSPEELTDLATAVTGRPLSADAASELHQRTAGNAFFATELLRLPTARGDTDDAALPEAVREVIERRLTPLGEEVRAVLDLAAVIGGSFDLGVLEAASGVSVDHVFDAVDLAVVTGIVLAGDHPGSFRFAHALVRDALLADLTPLRRQRLHARTAEALEHAPRHDPARQASEVAHHLVAAVSLVGLERAHAAARAAAVAAATRLAADEAAAWWRTAADLLQQHRGDPVQRGVDLVNAGRMLLLAGRVTDGRELLLLAVDEAEGRGDTTAAAKAAIAIGGSGGAWFWVDPGTSPTALIQRMERVLHALGPDEGALRVRLLGVLAPGVYYVDPGRAAALVRDGLRLARELGDQEVLASALLSAIACEWGPDTADRHLELSEELLTQPAEVRDPITEVACRLWRRNVHLERGHLEIADTELDRVAEVADGSRLQVLRAQVGIARVGHAWLRATPAEVDDAIDRAAELHRTSGLYRLEAVRLVNRALLRTVQGRLAEVAEELTELFDVGFGPNLFAAYMAWGRGQRDAAIRALEAGDDVPRSGTWQWLPGRVIRALAVTELEAVHLAPGLRDELSPYVGRTVVGGLGMTVLGPVDLYVGALSGLLGDLEAAERHLRAAVAWDEQSGSPIWGTLARSHLASVLHATGQLAAEAPWVDGAWQRAQLLGLGPAAARLQEARVALPT
jgi:DNA-binding SARP family transcriptional activator